MSTHLPGFQFHFLGFLHHFVLAKVATSSIRVNRSLTHTVPLTLSILLLSKAQELKNL